VSAVSIGVFNSTHSYLLFLVLNFLVVIMNQLKEKPKNQFAEVNNPISWFPLQLH